MGQLFDPLTRAQRRDRAARIGPELFLLERTFADCLERVEILDRSWDKALLLGCPDRGWPARLAATADVVEVEVVDPGPAFAAAANGFPLIEDHWQPRASSFDLIVAIGTLDTVNDLPAALFNISRSLRPGGLLIGAMSGGDTVPELRLAMAAADRVSDGAAAHIHPRIEASALAPLLEQAGLSRPVVDVDRVFVRYSSLARLVADLRAMAATNVLVLRPRQFLGKAGLWAAEAEFSRSAIDGRTEEAFEILHFAAWKPAH